MGRMRLLSDGRRRRRERRPHGTDSTDWTDPADPVRLTQALLNLVINALQAVNRNGWIEVKAASQPEALILEVRDNGPGIPQEKRDASSQPFF